MKPPDANTPGLAACLLVRGKNLLWLSVKAQPRARRNELAGLLGAELKVRVAAPPVDDAANDALVQYLADVLQLSRGAVRLRRGHTSTHKVIEIAGLQAAEAARRLNLSP